MKRHRFARVLVVSVLAVLALPVLSGAAHAAIQVNCPADNLQTAINSAASGETINITGTCTGNFTIDSKSLTLHGTNGDATLDGGGTGSTLSITGTGAETDTLDLLVVSGGATQGIGGGVHVEDGTVVFTRDLIQNNSAGSGGGGVSYVPSGGSGGLSFTDTTIRDNTVESPEFASGAGIVFVSFEGGIVSLSHTTVSGNRATGSDASNASAAGGGLEVDFGGLTMVDSTISGNTSAGAGTGSGTGGGIDFFSPSSVSITASTIAENTATGASGRGGGLYLEEGERRAFAPGVAIRASARAAADPTLTYTILATNTATTGPDCSQSFGTPWSMASYDIVGDTSGCGIVAGSNNQFDVNPMLKPLTNKGGWGKTHALQHASSAINAIPNAQCTVLTDQRNLSRPRRHGCDIGAYEWAKARHRAVCTILGTASENTIDGTKRDDAICGLSADDTLNGLVGDDVLFGWRNNDTLNGGVGNDQLWGEAGADTLNGGPGQDVVKGGFGSDQIDVADGEAGDVVDGGKGADTCTSDAGDTVTNC